MKPQLVLINPFSKEYKRFVGHTLTDHVVADRELSKEQIEQFRVNPSSMYEPEVA